MSFTQAEQLPPLISNRNLSPIVNYMFAEPLCGDYLQMIDAKPAHVEFLKCRQGKDAQLNVLFAMYRVAGIYAQRVESYFVRVSGMRPLSRVAAIWESVPKDGRRFGYLAHHLWPQISQDAANEFMVEMGTGETLQSRRDQWKNIDWFYIRVTYFLESP